MHTATIPLAAMNKPLNLRSKRFAADKYAYYAYLREHDPVHRGRVLPMVRATFLARYDDCASMLKDPRLVRNRTTATGGRRTPIPLPRSAALLLNGMINADGADHRRLRNLVHKAFTPRAITALEGSIKTLSHALLDRAEAEGSVELVADFARPIPVAVIAAMVGVDTDQVPKFAGYIRAITEGMGGMTLLRTFFWDLPRATAFIRELIAEKRRHPADDILTRLIDAEDDGERLSEDELAAMVFLIIIAGHETTYNLITNAVFTLLTHPDQLRRLREDPSLIDLAIEEVMRFNGPVHSTKPEYATEDLTIGGVLIPKGSAVLPLLGSANRDEAVFADADVFDIGRTPNRHLGFGMGVHYCLGAPLARMETKIALLTLLERNPNLRFAVKPETIELAARIGWHQYKTLPLLLG